MNPAAPALKSEHRAEGMDEVDHRIVALLRRDGRMPYRSIANELGLTEATVRSRVRRMEESDSMRVVAVTDIEAAGFGMLLAVGVEVEGRPASAVAEELATIDEVFSVSVVIGSHDIEILDNGLSVEEDIEDTLSGFRLVEFSEVKANRVSPLRAVVLLALAALVDQDRDAKRPDTLDAA